MNVRKHILKIVADYIVQEGDLPLLKNEYLRRFSNIDLAETIQSLWEKYPDYPKVREFLMRIIWLGKIKLCEEIVTSVAFKGDIDIKHDPYYLLQAFAGRALMTIGNEKVKKDYADFVVKNCKKLAGPVIWDAIENLFPKHITIEQFLCILSHINAADNDIDTRLEWEGKQLVDLVQTVADLTCLLWPAGAGVRRPTRESQDIGRLKQRKNTCR